MAKKQLLNQDIWQKAMNAVKNQRTMRRTTYRSNQPRRHNSMPYNIMDYVDWLIDRGRPLKYEQAGDNSFHVWDGNPQGNHDLSSLNVYLDPDRYHRGGTISSFRRYSSNSDTWKSKLPALNRFAIMMHDHFVTNDLSVNSKDAAKWADQQLRQFKTSYGYTHPHTEHSYGANGITSRGRSYSRGDGDVAQQTEDGKNINTHRDYELYFQNRDRSIKPNNRIAYDYLTKTRGIDGKFAKYFIKEGLIRSYAAGTSHWKDRKTGQMKSMYRPNRVEFIRRMPRSNGDIHTARYGNSYMAFLSKSGREQVNMMSPAKRRIYLNRLNNATDAGIDAIYVKKDKNGFWQNDRNLKINGHGVNCKHIDHDNVKNYGFNFHTGNGRDQLYVFEAPIDAMSYLNLHSKNHAMMRNATFLSLGGSGTKTDTIKGFMKRQFATARDFNHIIITPDNDDAGHTLVLKATEGIKDKKAYSIAGKKYLSKLSKLERPITRETGIKEARAILKGNMKVQGKIKKHHRIVTTEVPVDKNGSVMTDQSKGFDWNDALKEHVFDKVPIQDNSVCGGKPMNLSQYKNMVIAQKMNKMTPYGQQCFDQMMGAYSRFYNNVSHNDEWVNSFNPRVEVMRTSYKGYNPYKDKHPTWYDKKVIGRQKGMTSNDRKIMNDLMSNAGGFNLSGGDLARGTAAYLNSHAEGNIRQRKWVQRKYSKVYGVPKYRKDVAKAMVGIEHSSNDPAIVGHVQKDFAHLINDGSDQEKYIHDIKTYDDKYHMNNISKVGKFKGDNNLDWGQGSRKNAGLYAKKWLEKPKEARSELYPTYRERREYMNGKDPYAKQKKIAQARKNSKARQAKVFKQRQNVHEHQQKVKGFVNGVHKVIHNSLVHERINKPFVNALRKHNVTDEQMGHMGFIQEINHLPEKAAKAGLSKQEMMRTGLFTTSKDGHIKSKFSDQVVHFDDSGNVQPLSPRHANPMYTKAGPHQIIGSKDIYDYAGDGMSRISERQLKLEDKLMKAQDNGHQKLAKHYDAENKALDKKVHNLSGIIDIAANNPHLKVYKCDLQKGHTPDRSNELKAKRERTQSPNQVSKKGLKRTPKPKESTQNMQEKTEPSRKSKNKPIINVDKAKKNIKKYDNMKPSPKTIKNNKEFDTNMKSKLNRSNQERRKQNQYHSHDFDHSPER